MVIDTSALLAVFFNEALADWVAERLAANAGDLSMSTVNLAELLIRVRDRQPKLANRIDEEIMSSGIRFVPPDSPQAHVAAQARLRWPLNLGDCFAYALAVAEDAPILTLDRDFRATDRPLVAPW